MNSHRVTDTATAASALVCVCVFFLMTVFDYTTVTTNGCRIHSFIHSFVLPHDALTHLHHLTHFYWEFDASQTFASQMVFFVLYCIFHSVTILLSYVHKIDLITYANMCWQLKSRATTAEHILYIYIFLWLILVFKFCEHCVL